MSENDSLQELAEEQAALRRVATLVAVEHDPERVFAAVTEEAGRRVGAQTSNLARFGDGDTALIVGAWSEGGVSAMPNGATVPLDGPTVSALVRRTGRAARVDDFTELSGTLAARIRELGLYSGVGAPVHVGGELWGALIVSSVRPNGFPSDAEHRVAEFAELAGVAVAEADGREHLQRMADEQAALRRVATLVAVEHDAPTLFAKVTEEAARVMGALQGNLTRYEGEDGAFVLGHWVAEGGVAGVDAGEHVTLDGQTVSGLVRDTGRPSRVDDYSEATGPLARRIHDLGIRSAVGAPIRVGGELWGVLTVQSEQPHFFAERAEERVQAFTDLVAAAVSETEARERLRRLAEEQTALRRVATVVAVEHDPVSVFATVTEEAARVMGASQANIARYEGSHDAMVVGAWNADGRAPGLQRGERVTLDGQTVSGLVHDSGQSAHVDDYALSQGPLVERLARLGLRSAVGAPVRVGGELWGALVVSSDRPGIYGPDAERRVQDFAELVSAALSEAEAREQLAASRARIVEASYEARRQIERDLHDGAQQRLVALALDLRGVESQLERSPEGAAPHLAQARGQLEEALAELRELARGIHPGVLTDRGLVPALDSLASRSPVPVETEADLEGRLTPAVEAAAYFVVSEALANVAKYASATAVSVQVAREDGLARVTVRDDGVGGADPTAGSGLRGLRDRVEALGGRLEVESPAGEGTTVCVELPVA